MVGAFRNTNSTRKAREKAEEVLATLALDHLRDMQAANLTIADRKRLEIARALATDPEILLLDEVMAGLRPTEVDDMITIIKGLRGRGLTVFVIEHIMRAVMALSDRVVVIHFGQKIAEGSPEEVTKDENVIKAYLGGEYVAA
jgi:branched-chain amino acid transport system ATP-binding protein